MRAVEGTSKRWAVMNSLGQGNLITCDSDCSGAYIEIVAYCNNINLMGYQATNAADDIDVYVNGTLTLEGKTAVRSAAALSLIHISEPTRPY